MTPAPLPAFESERLSSVRSYDVLDAAADAAFDDLAAVAAQLTGCPIAVVSLVEGDHWQSAACFGIDRDGAGHDAAFGASAIPAGGWVMVVADAALDARFADHPLVRGPPGVRCLAGVALLDRKGGCLGTLCVLDRTPRPFTPEQRDGLAVLARAMAHTLDLRRAAWRLREMALTDPLTGLANRPAFFGALDRAITRQRRFGRGFGLVCVDLDGFKTVNDRHGHGAGDTVLRAVARSLLACTRREDIVARIGGDEFAALLGGGKGRDIARVAERIRRAIRAGTAVSGAAVSASIGAVTFLAAPADPVAALIAADRLLYVAKAAGKDHAEHCEIGADAAATRPRAARPVTVPA